MATSGLEHTGLLQASLKLSAGQVYNSTLTFFLLFKPEILNFSGIGRKVRVELLPTKIEKSNSLQLDPDFRVDFLEKEFAILGSRNLLLFGQGQVVASTNGLSALSNQKTLFGLQTSQSPALARNLKLSPCDLRQATPATLHTYLNTHRENENPREPSFWSVSSVFLVARHTSCPSHTDERGLHETTKPCKTF